MGNSSNYSIILEYVGIKIFPNTKVFRELYPRSVKLGTKLKVFYPKRLLYFKNLYNLNIHLLFEHKTNCIIKDSNKLHWRLYDKV